LVVGTERINRPLNSRRPIVIFHDENNDGDDDAHAVDDADSGHDDDDSANDAGWLTNGRQNK